MIGATEEKTTTINFASVRDTGESIQGTYKRQNKFMPVRMYSFISSAGAYACTCTQARKCK